MGLTIKGIAGTTYLCSKFTNHDGTVVSDHPLYLFQTDDENIWLGVMFTSKTNPFTTHYEDGNNLYFIGCSDHKGEYPSSKVFQAEVYVINKADKNLKYCEYSFGNPSYSQELLKALKKAIAIGIKTEYKFGMVSVHDYNNKDNREDMDEIMNMMNNYLDEAIKKCYYKTTPAVGPRNCEYDPDKKMRNQSNTKYTNRQVWSRKEF